VLAFTGPPDLSGPDPSIARSATLSRRWPPTRAAIPATRSAADMAGPAYSPLLKGGYVSQEKLDAAEFGHPGTPARLAALRELAKDAGVTVNQVVLAWLIGAEVPVIPLIGGSSAAQLDESLAAVDLELTTEQRTRLDAAR
jgi:aryl-alcohol dehydrogenase-like predicted oxidoreductase